MKKQIQISSAEEQMLLDLLPEGVYVRTVRVSQARLGSSKWGPYYDTVRCQVRRGKTVPLVVRPLERATKNRRSFSLAAKDADKYKDHVFLNDPGFMDQTIAAKLLRRLAKTDDPLNYIGVDQAVLERLGCSETREALEKLGVAERALGLKALYSMVA